MRAYLYVLTCPLRRKRATRGLPSASRRNRKLPTTDVSTSGLSLALELCQRALHEEKGR